MLEQNLMQPQAQSQPQAVTGGVRARILVVEDDRDTMNWLSVLLRQSNFDVMGAGDGTQAMNMAVREKPDLVILDIGLPAGNGIFVLENIRRNEAISLTPVIVWSGAPAFRPNEAIEAGASCFLPKPCSNETILHAVEAALLTAAHHKAQFASAAAPPPVPTEIPASPFGQA